MPEWMKQLYIAALANKCSCEGLVLYISMFDGRLVWGSEPGWCLGILERTAQGFIDSLQSLGGE